MANSDCQQESPWKEIKRKRHPLYRYQGFNNTKWEKDGAGTERAERKKAELSDRLQICLPRQ